MKEDEFDAGVEKYLEGLTRVKTVDDLLKIVRDASAWALAAHRKEVEEKKKRRIP